MSTCLITKNPPSHLNPLYFGRKLGWFLEKAFLVNKKVNKYWPKCSFQKVHTKSYKKHIYRFFIALKLFSQSLKVSAKSPFTKFNVQKHIKFFSKSVFQSLDLFWKPNLNFSGISVFEDVVNTEFFCEIFSFFFWKRPLLVECNAPSSRKIFKRTARHFNWATNMSHT